MNVSDHQGDNPDGAYDSSGRSGLREHDDSERRKGAHEDDLEYSPAP
jgi:hypothetical protein